MIFDQGKAVAAVLSPAGFSGGFGGRVFFPGCRVVTWSLVFCDPGVLPGLHCFSAAGYFGGSLVLSNPGVLPGLSRFPAGHLPVFSAVSAARVTPFMWEGLRYV